MSTLASVAATLAICCFRLRMASHSPMRLGNNTSSSDVPGSESSVLRDCLSSTALFTVSSSLRLSHGFGMKSTAPALIALTAFSVSTYAVMNSTTLFGSCSNMRASHSYPSSPLIASRLKFMSRMMTSGWNESINSMTRSGLAVTLTASTYGLSSILSDSNTSSLSSTTSIRPLGDSTVFITMTYENIFNFTFAQP